MKFDLQPPLLDVVHNCERASRFVEWTYWTEIDPAVVDSAWLAGGGMEMSNLRCVVSAVGGAPASLRLPRRPAAKLGKPWAGTLSDDEAEGAGTLKTISFTITERVGSNEAIKTLLKIPCYG